MCSVCTVFVLMMWRGAWAGKESICTVFTIVNIDVLCIYHLATYLISNRKLQTRTQFSEYATLFL